MAIDIHSEQLISLEVAVESLPRRDDGRPLHVRTIRRWASVGVRGHRLETVLIGGRRLTSREALGRFLVAINAPPESRPAAPIPSNPGVAAELDRLGY